jgi:CopG family transcriptional regulator, nickel-responsive regulator
MDFPDLSEKWPGCDMMGRSSPRRLLMKDLARTGISLEHELLQKFDDAIGKKGYQNRSEAIRDLIREHLVADEIDKNKVVVGTLTIVYDHHRPNLTEKLVEAQHGAGGKVLAATHVHLDHHNCLEVIIMKGRGRELKDLADRILSLRGVKHGQLVVTSTGKDLE